MKKRTLTVVRPACHTVLQSHYLYHYQLPNTSSPTTCTWHGDREAKGRETTMAGTAHAHMGGEFQLQRETLVARPPQDKGSCQNCT